MRIFGVRGRVALIKLHCIHALVIKGTAVQTDEPVSGTKAPVPNGLIQPLQQFGDRETQGGFGCSDVSRAKQ